MSAKMKEIMADLYMDPGLMARFQKDPKAVFKEKGVDMPEDVTLNVLADTEKVKHIVLPFLGTENLYSVEDFEQRLSKSSSPFGTLI